MYTPITEGSFPTRTFNLVDIFYTSPATSIGLVRNNTSLTETSPEGRVYWHRTDHRGRKIHLLDEYRLDEANIPGQILAQGDVFSEDPRVDQKGWGRFAGHSRMGFSGVVNNTCYPFFIGPEGTLFIGIEGKNATPTPDSRRFRISSDMHTIFELPDLEEGDYSDNGVWDFEEGDRRLRRIHQENAGCAETAWGSVSYSSELRALGIEAMHGYYTNGKVDYGIFFAGIPDGESPDAKDQRRFVPHEASFTPEYLAWKAGIPNLQAIAGKNIDYSVQVKVIEDAFILNAQIGDWVPLRAVGSLEDAILHRNEGIGAIDVTVVPYTTVMPG